VQYQLQCFFTHWGLPRRLRVDNGKPWGSWSDLPPWLALWLIGLGIEMIWNDACCPQQNGIIERSQGTGKRWAEPQQCVSVEHLQAEVDEADRLQREAYPLVQGRSRLELFPQLRHSGRAYGVADEKSGWDLQRVLGHLSGYAVTRRVDRTGQVSLYNRNYYVGIKHKGTTVCVMFDPQSREWLFTDEAGRQVRSQPAREISAEQIRTLNPAGGKKRLSRK
jgi:hypothetical protein